VQLIERIQASREAASSASARRSFPNLRRYRAQEFRDRVWPYRRASAQVIEIALEVLEPHATPPAENRAEHHVPCASLVISRGAAWLRARRRVSSATLAPV